MIRTFPINELNHTTNLRQFSGPIKTLNRQVTERIRQEIADKLIAKVSDSLDTMVDAQIEAASGESYLGDKKLPPNPNAFKALMEYTVSKAPEKKDIRVALGITHLIASLESDGDSDEDN